MKLDRLPRYHACQEDFYHGLLAGITVFPGLSFAEFPALAWFIVGFSVVTFFLWQAGQLRVRSVLILCVAGGLSVWPDFAPYGEAGRYWSPYYRVSYDPKDRSISANTMMYHQSMRACGEPSSLYSLVHLLWRDAGGTPFADTLIIGAGSGNDVAHSLRHGAQHVDAVEIDPVIARLGQRYHPDRPYDDPRVRVYLDDGRNFLRMPTRKYDLVVYALVDSLILQSSYSNIRLESFLFTEQAFREVRNVLKPDGLFVMYNQYRQGWVVARVVRMLERQFGQMPLVLSIPHRMEIRPDDNLKDHVSVIIAGNIQRLTKSFRRHPVFGLNYLPTVSETVNGFEVGERLLTRSAGWVQLAPTQVGSSAASLSTATDDWPFLYLRRPMVPKLYLRGALLILVIALCLLFALSRGLRVGLNGRMFFLGAAFLLIETKAVVHLALVFGSTWLVNSWVFFSILVMILAGNLYVLKTPRAHLGRHYLALFACLALNAAVPLDVFLAGNLIWKYVVSSLLVMIPMFFAAVIFAVSFRQSQRPEQDFGANIAGAVVGGLTEYSSMLLGFRYLVGLAMVFYALSALFGRRGSSAAC